MYVSWTTTTCEVRGTRFRKHKCESCRAVYGYKMERVVRESIHSLGGRGVAAARKRAEEEARDALAAELAEGFDAVPCPNCGWYQSRMVKDARDERHQILAKVWSGCIALGGMLFALAGLIYLTNRDSVPTDPGFKARALAGIWGGGAAVVFGVVLAAFDAWQRDRLDLNHQPRAERLDVAREKGAVIVTPAPCTRTGKTAKPAPDDDGPFELD